MADQGSQMLNMKVKKKYVKLTQHRNMFYEIASNKPVKMLARSIL